MDTTSPKCNIEIEFQGWLQHVNDEFAYVLSSPECAARQAFEAGYNTRDNEIENAPDYKKELERAKQLLSQALIQGISPNYNTPFQKEIEEFLI